jgi:hypothetical protein
MSNKYYSPDGNLEVWDTKPEGYYTEEEWAELHPAPEPPEPTTEEKLAALDADYNQQKQDLINEYTDAQIHGDTDTIELVQQEMTELDEWYDEEYRKIEEGEAE